MVLNISSRNVRLIIGSQDWSAWIEADSGIQVGYPEYQVGSGLKPVEGSITLEFSAYDPNLPSSPNPLLNAAQWQREQTISIEAVNDAGALEYVPCSGQLLYILKTPQRLRRSLDGLQQLQIQVGCRLALEYFPPEPNKDVSGVVAGTPLDRGTVISNILSFIGVPSAIGPIPYPIDYPLPKIEGNWIQMCGELASTAGYYLRCDVDGTVIAESISLLPSSSVRNYLIGRDEELFDPSGDFSEQPLEKLIISGIKQIVEPVDNAPKVIVDSQPFSKVFPDIAGFNPNPIAASEVTKKSEKLTADLFQYSETTRKPFSLLFPDVLGFDGSLTFAESKVTQYFLKNGICYKTIETINQPFTIVFPEIAGFNSNPTLVKRTEIEWERISDRNFRKTTNIYEPFSKVFTNVAGIDLSPVLVSSNVDETDTTGAPTNFGDLGDNTIKEEPIKVEVFAEQLSPSRNRDRQNTINLLYAGDRGQLQNYGQTFNRFLSGRAQGFQWSGKIEWLTPFQQVSVTEDDTVYYLKVDGLQWAINLVKASTLWYGVLVGFASAETPEEIVRPVEISLGNFVAETKFNIYGISEELLASQGITQFNIYANRTIVWGIAETQFDIYAINDLAPSIYKAYWAFEDIVSGFALNELGDTNYDLNLSSGSPSIITGKVNNSITGLSTELPTSVPVPFWDLNLNNFVGFALWFYPKTGGSGQRVFIENTIAGSTISWKLEIDYDTTEITLSAHISGFGLVEISSAVTIDDWSLVICELDKTAGTLSLKLNNGTKISDSQAITGQSIPLPLKIGSSDVDIDELFFFSEPLDGAQESAIWNSGSGATYPPF